MTMALSNAYLRCLIPRIVLVGYVICLCPTNIFIRYISRSIPSLYGRLDFFQFTVFSSHQIGNSWVVPKEGFHLSPLTNAGLRFALHTQPEVDLRFCLAPASHKRRLGISTHTSLERSSTWYLCITELGL